MNRTYLRIGAVAIVIAFGVNCSDVTQPTPVTGLSITSLVPTSGPASGGTSVTVSGSNFTSSAGVRFGSVPAEVLFVNSSRLIVTTPPHTAGVVDVTVVLGGASTTLSSGFTYSN